MNRIFPRQRDGLLQAGNGFRQRAVVLLVRIGNRQVAIARRRSTRRARPTAPIARSPPPAASRRADSPGSTAPGRCAGWPSWLPATRQSLRTGTENSTRATSPRPACNIRPPSAAGSASRRNSPDSSRPSERSPTAWARRQRPPRARPCRPARGRRRGTRPPSPRRWPDASFMAVANGVASAASREASQRSAITRTSNGSHTSSARAAQAKASSDRPRCRSSAADFRLSARMFSELVWSDCSAKSGCRRHVAARGGDLGKRLVAGRPPCHAPGGLVEALPTPRRSCPAALSARPR